MTSDEIEELIKTKKKIVSEPQKSFKVEGVNRRNGFKVQSVGGNHEFSVFIRQHAIFEENFSVGLIYHSVEGKKVMLIRMNGPHGATTNNPLNNNAHYGYHIHQISPNEIEADNLIDPKFSEFTTLYDSLDSAIVYFIKYTNIVDCAKYFSNFDQQLNLFE